MRKDNTSEEATEQLRDKGYRFVHRLNDVFVILASLPNEKNYMLFQHVDRPTLYCASLRKKWQKFVKPITQDDTSELYMVALNADKDKEQHV